MPQLNLLGISGNILRMDSGDMNDTE